MTHETTTDVAVIGMAFGVLAWLRALAAEKEAKQLRLLRANDHRELERVGHAIDRLVIDQESFEWCTDESIEDLCQRIYELQEAKQTARTLNWRAN